MEDKKNSQLYAILGGVITCFICLAVVFLFPKGSSNLSKSNYNNLIPNNSGIVANNSNEEISLGDTCENQNYNYTTKNSTVTDRNDCKPNPTDGSNGSCTATELPGSGGNAFNCTCTYHDVRSVCTSCDPGRYLKEGKCETCPSGKYCSGGTQEPRDCSTGWVLKDDQTGCECAAGYTRNDALECVQCSGNTYKEYAGNFECFDCPQGQEPNPGHTACVAQPTGVCCCNTNRSECSMIAGSSSCPSSSQTAVAQGETSAQCQAHVVAEPKGVCCCNTNNSQCSMIVGSSSCPSSSQTAVAQGETSAQCQAHVVAEPAEPKGVCCCNTNNSQCSMIVGSSSCPSTTQKVVAQGVTAAQCQTHVEPTGVCCCTSDRLYCSMIAGNSSCPSSSQTAVAQGVTAAQCQTHAKEIPEKCEVHLETKSVSTSITTEENDSNSYYVVSVTVSGKDCGGQIVKYSCTNCKKNPPTNEYKINKEMTTYSTSFWVYPETECHESKTTATLTNTNSDYVVIAKNNIRTDWVYRDGYCETSPKYTSFEAADRAGANFYYSNYGNCQNGGTGYTRKWTRGGCGGGTPNDPPTPTPSDPRHCYLTNDGYEFHNESEAKSHGEWKIADDKVFGNVCGPTPGCYMKNSDGTYHVLKEQQDGYTYISSETDEKKCNPESYACYVKKVVDEDQKEHTYYEWSSTQPSGYTKVDLSKDKCQNPACYVHGDKVDWGYYEGQTGYIKLEDVDEEECVIPGEGSDACYVDKNGNYVWGKYEDDPNYTVVPSVTDKAQCNNNVPVTPTGTSTSTIIYIFMAILMAFGIGFIYYSTVLNKNN